MATTAALVFAGKSVATPAISSLVTKAFTYLNEYHRTAGMEEMKNRILLALPKIQAVFDVVNPVHIKEESSALDAWLWQLRDAVEEAEVALDEIEYHELEEKAKDRKVIDWGSSGAKMKHEVVRYIKHVSILDKTVKGLTHRGTLKRLRKSVEVLDRTAAGVADFLALSQHLKGSSSHQEEYFLNRDRETGSTITATQVFGRRKEKELVVGWLTKTSHEDAEIVVSTNHVSVVSIVGHGEMGKTTLAQLIYQDDGVTNHFDKVIWACVSTSFETTTIISKILESATWAKPDANTYEALQQILREKLNSVKFLLILDDVWEDEKIDQWEKLFAPLRTGKYGSKILLTTRMQRVADVATRVMGGEQKCLPLQGLEEDENIKHFNHHAFASLNLQDYAGLQSIGEHIAKKATRCPLVTKVIGAHLRDNMTTEFWDRFLHEGLDHFKRTEKDIMGVLRLSYYHLPTELQTCFRYCSIFCQDYNFEKEELVKMWMSSGLISQTAIGPEGLMEIGEQYLAQLTRKSFFDLRFNTYDHGRINEEPGYYVMHDLMHDLAKDVSSGECARIVDVASFENVVSTVRHIHFDEDTCSLSVEEIKKKIAHWKNLRTVIIRYRVYNEDILSTLEEAVVHSKSLRLFKTDNSKITSHFVGKLGKLKLLRCIMLSRLPPKTSVCGIAKLYHLRILSCASVETEPKHFRDLGNLDRLQYVSYGSYGFGNFHIGRLTSLRFLKDYLVQGSKGYTISALKDLTSLRQLGLEGLENVANHEEAEDAKLKEKQYLQSLSLEWSECNGAQSSTHDLILDQLEPHANLKKLRISGYNGSRLPNWIVEPSVKNLLKLEFESCGNCEQLPFLPELRMLKHLGLADLPKLKNIGQALDVPRSACIEFSLPPSLGALVIRNCPELRELPPLPPSLVSFEIAHVGLTRLPRIGKLCSESIETKSSQLLMISVKDCACLTWSEGSLLEQTQYMGALKVLCITDCVHLESGSLAFEEMTGLRELEITNCPMSRTLRNVGDSILPSSLEKLTMGQCGNLELPLLGSLQRLTNLSGLELQNCSGFVSLPCADVFGTSLKSLTHIIMKGCENLSSLGGLGSVPYLDHLEIVGCSKLAEVGSSHQIPHASGGEEENLAPSTSSTYVVWLRIDLPSLLLVEPLKSFCQTQFLTIGDGSEMETLPEWWLQQNRTSLQLLQIHGAESLVSLPPSMRDFSCLKRLDLYGAEKLRSLPDMPSSLYELFIWGCDSELEKKSRGYGSPGLNRISHIRIAHIADYEPVKGNLRFIMGKECSQETYYRLWQAGDATLSSLLNESKDGQRIMAAPHWLKKHFCLENAS